MKIKLVEDIVDELNQKANRNRELLNEAETILKDNGFELANEINGISYNIENEDVNASFYIGNDLSYKGYITNNGNESINFNCKGTEDTLISTLEKFIEEWDDINEGR